MQRNDYERQSISRYCKYEYYGQLCHLNYYVGTAAAEKAPKVFSYALWFVAFFRLLVPVSFESILSILPFNTTLLSTDMLYIETPYVETGVKAIDSVINPVVATEVFGSNANVYQIFTFWGKIIWFIGVFAFCLYSIRSYSKLKKKLQSAVLLRDNIYISQVISTPFALGLRNPKYTCRAIWLTHRNM